MGSQASKDISTAHSNPPKNSCSSIKNMGLSISSLDNMNDSSNYNGISIEKPSTNKKTKNYISNNATKDNSINEQKSKYIINFLWEEGGNEIYITGSFCNWNERLKMYKNKKNIFELKIVLPKGQYEFKYIVDGVWKCSSLYPQKYDNKGNNNNYIDISDINDNLKININNSENTRPNLDDMKKNYNNIYPNKDQLNWEATKIPDVFEILLDLNDNSNQKFIGTKQYLNFSLTNFDETYKKILNPFHSYLNHLFTYNNIRTLKIANYSNNDKSNSEQNIKKSNYIGINCNIKIKNKYISIVYYSPLNKI